MADDFVAIVRGLASPGPQAETEGLGTRVVRVQRSVADDEVVLANDLRVLATQMIAGVREELAPGPGDGPVSITAHRRGNRCVVEAVFRCRKTAIDRLREAVDAG